MKRKYLLAILVGLLLVQGYFYIEALRETRAMARSQEALEALQNLRQEPESPPFIESPIVEAPSIETPKTPSFKKKSNPFDAYYRINSDYQGWLSVTGTRIDYPVVRGQDNTYYLDRNFQKEKDILGSVFMDYRNVGMGIDTHTIIYGHYTKSGAMFGQLDRYMNLDYLLEHPEFTFTDPHTERRYRIFSVHISPSEGSMIDMNFKGEEYQEFLDLLIERSHHELGVTVEPHQRILSLITCNYAVEDGRLFIHAVELKD